MTLTMSMLLFGLVLGLVAVACNPSPYFAALGLVGVAGLGCGVLVCHGGSFLSLVLFLIYLGGMLVVFAYTAALAAEPFPEGWGSGRVMVSGVGYVGGVFWGAYYAFGQWHEASWLSSEEGSDFYMFRGDVGGVAMMYSGGGGMLIISAWALLLTLFVVLELTRGLGRGSLRAV
uniref:NADH-ubiquinone oxidoreductase chain 6 n=2 Tax=Branchiostegus TaxID=270561 RepID=C6F5P5_BRAJA|nr:NADH dehydrogenase subunit 6 [Branchiostegus japonicus]YP_003002311.1 NADH dehydrogenase subunit 6 [Branchiostegus albus]ACF24613.1 NADH dehydrogenase subunit 6 [Branchiostegus japonicus]ACF24626.1 NADH dehydrogenase subunit 6 [Branchiostegus albus]BBU25967.1 NADH dehydrogenase subunit 6 [Branchiostegus japonicus]